MNAHLITLFVAIHAFTNLEFKFSVEVTHYFFKKHITFKFTTNTFLNKYFVLHFSGVKKNLPSGGGFISLLM